VPIATGFHGISELGFAEHQRDPNTPHRFAESLVTLGEFVMPYRLKRLEQLLWHGRYDAQNNLYLTEQHPRNA
jgi:CRISPR-associated protein Csy2